MCNFCYFFFQLLLSWCSSSGDLSVNKTSGSPSFMMTSMMTSGRMWSTMMRKGQVSQRKEIENGKANLFHKHFIGNDTENMIYLACAIFCELDYQQLSIDLIRYISKCTLSKNLHYLDKDTLFLKC